MSLTAGMQTVCESIAGSKPLRKAFLKKSFGDTHAMLKTFSQQRDKTRSFCAKLRNDCKAMLHSFGTQRQATFRNFITPLRQDVKGMHEVFARFAASHFETTHPHQPASTKKAKKK